MGLDVYLYTAAAAAQKKAHDQASDEWYEPGPDGKSPRDRATDEERKAWAANHLYPSHEDAPSEEFPEHLFNRRYLRSSYNDGGFNHAVPDLLGTSTSAEYPNARGSLYWIFDPMEREWDGDEGSLTDADVAKLEACHDRALEVHDELTKSDRLRVLTVSPNLFNAPPTTTDHAALAQYRAILADTERPFADDGWWSRGEVNVYGAEGVTVLAAIPGAATFNIPGVHLIYRMDEGGFDSYVQSAKITAEFCAEAIALIRRDGSCQMSWSG